MSAPRACEHCGGALPPSARRHARFCSPAHRRAAFRAHNPDRRRVRARFLGAPDAKKPAPVAHVAIVPDAKWPGMYRIRRPDSFTDMVNLTRARDALAELQRLRMAK
jgi:hypothetical protein